MASKAKKTMKYAADDLKKALDAIDGGMPILKASKIFKIPRTTLIYKHKGIYPKECRKGPPTNLIPDEEKSLVKWLGHIGDCGFPATKTQLLDSVEMLMKEVQEVKMKELLMSEVQEVQSATINQTNIPYDVPNPFKNCLFWPVQSNEPKSNRLKEKIPSVMTSEEWKEYYYKKNAEKERKEKEKEERKRKMKAAEKPKKKKKTAKK